MNHPRRLEAVYCLGPDQPTFRATARQMVSTHTHEISVVVALTAAEEAVLRAVWEQIQKRLQQE